MYIVGLTGGLATGKSTVLSYFKENNIPVMDADEIAREIVEPGQAAWRKIVSEFGPQVLLENGRINRMILGMLVFDDIEKRKKLNAITHPQIQKALIKNAIMRCLEGHAFIVMELPLLFESGRMMSLIHKIITVVCDDVQQLERLCQRNSFPEDVARKRIASQMPLEEKVISSQFVINNDGTLEDTRKQTENIIRSLRSSKFHWYIRGGILGLAMMPCTLYFIYLSFFT
ncbi:dephospho-CoA kinase [Arctopsyche grandis]|uniref:dephospho-CoA kinase n=1 Tax=Arctopsyche grandis TaxID=121162 RepID=UPI00406D773C